MNNLLEHQKVGYGFIKISPDGNIIEMNREVEGFFISDHEETTYIFQRIESSELRTKLHQCFMGKCNQFIVDIDSQPHFFIFHKIFQNQKLSEIHLYSFNIEQLKKTTNDKNWNLHLLSSIGEMSAGIAHEVRNPLTAVKGFLQLLNETNNTEYIHIAQSELERAITILNDLMSVSSPEFKQEQYTSFNIVTELESTLLLFQNQLYKIHVEKNIQSSNAMVVGRKDQIKKAFFNLIKNAIEAMPDGGTLTIKQCEDRDGINMVISDTGVGIPKDKLRLLGTPFFTLKQEGKGMGIAQVYNAMQNNNAKIYVDSEEGRGTTFTLNFPKRHNHMNEMKVVNDMATDVITTEKSLSKFLEDNVEFYANEWYGYITEHKSYISELFQEHEREELLYKGFRVIMQIVSKSIKEISTEEIMDWGKKLGTNRAKNDIPINVSCELFQSSRGFIWNAIKSFYQESDNTLDMDEFFALERRVNDIIDMFIDSFTSYYVKYKDELLQSQRETVDELSVPVIPISDHVCILPIVGNVDTYRAKKIREQTLLQVNKLKAEKLIIDISGVPFVDTAVVNHLFKIVKGIRLLGCSTTLTGISPEIADTMIELGIEIDSAVKTRSDLQQALQEIGLHD